VNPQDPLASLHPLREPELIGWWPLAPGWWILLIMGILIVVALTHLLRKRYRKNAYRRRALRQLQSLHAEYQVSQDVSHYLGQINALLKSVALQGYPRPEVAARHGEAWRTFLNLSLPPGNHFQQAFDTAAYQKSCPEIDMIQVHQAAQHWIRHHKVAS
jgi:hypothetical protein